MHAAFTAWLRERMHERGHSTLSLAEASGVKRHNIQRMLRGEGGRPSEPNARALAVPLGDDPDHIAALAGYLDATVPVPDPRGFTTPHEWIAAVLEARHETPERADAAIGRGRGCLRRVLAYGYTPDRPTLRAFAAYVGADPIQVLALRPKIESFARHAREVNARRGAERTRELLDRARAAPRRVTAEQRSEFGRLGAAVSARRVTQAQLEQRLAWRAAGQAARTAARLARARERGSWFRSPETRAAAIEKQRARDPASRRRGWETIVERGDAERILARLRALNARRRSRQLYTCAVCGKPTERNPSHKRSEKVYHRECYFALTRSPEARERSAKMMTLINIRRRVAGSGDVGLLIDVEDQIKAELRRLRDPRAEGRPPTLLENYPLAIEMARLQHDGGLSAGEVAQLADLPTRRDASGSLKAGSRAMELLRLGRALRGYRRLDPGPRRRAS